MTRNEHGAVILSADETKLLARLVAIRKLEDAEDWLEWEDLPQLDEDGFNMVADAIRDQAAAMSVSLLLTERAYNIDARHIYSEVTA